MNKLFAAIAVVAALGLAGTSAHAAGMKFDWVEPAVKLGKQRDAENYRGCVNLYGQTAAAVKGCQKVWAKRLPNAENNDNYRRCANMYGVKPCQKIWAGKL